ncbi:MAG: methyltransferase [Patescibacteria group bacterium]|nr:methyltransferase [Patescibacteria group bacterium]
MVCGDFLEQNGNLGRFDKIIMNPPFSDGADIKHILHARTFLNPGGLLVAICANGPRQQEALKPIAESWEDLPAGSFKESGTGVNAALLTIKG